MHEERKPFALTPLFCLMGIATGFAGLFWYDSQSREKQEDIDEQAVRFARQLFNKSVGQLSPDEAQQIRRLTEDYVL